MSEPIIDAHHHIWRQADQPWLQGPTVPRIFGAYDAIKRDYPVEEFLGDIKNTGVVKSVYVQTNWAVERAIEEVDWVHSEAERTGWPHAIVSFVDLQSDNAAEVMKAQSRSPLMRGVRQQLHWHENTLYRFAAKSDLMNTPAFRQNIARLEEYGWLFELQVFASQMADGAALAASFPNITFVLEHAGMPEDLSKSGRDRWLEGMKLLAQQPNVNTKFSGLGTFIRKNDAQHISEIVGQTLELFGPDRCVWGSNFPIEKLWTSYADIVSAIRNALKADEGMRRRVLHDNAARLYRL
ncbi:amidohydrolase [Variibacter gotjawalensis]|uniref:Amidohydrolase n=1 Tax=Variibacter gotjawalensis TaxID=1333996 RepID=A0A0S3PRN1_9BRAD|nr:amidohydrolase family protein [Variibacter gotjawalensis]NIK48913.1 putative TIM-barrel fold metal-dependent hydrolase [Variibacter gotjawalensis]RZS50769.1 putative TIM-barrel fold metal-dependent hydrolase [Variibacter gotjawalensis]BAT58603.1 amidohydrolase [Variibacter gotjawalensis]